MIVVIPMAGRGSRFSHAGFHTPKPLIEVAGKPMVIWALDSLVGVKFNKIIFVALAEHNKVFKIDKLLHGIYGWKTEFVFIEETTEGQLCTVFAAQDLLSDNEDILIAASDSYIKSSIGSDINSKGPQCAGLISVISQPGDHWSFAKTDSHNKVVEVAEKKRISDHCSTGLYYFSRFRDFSQFGSELIRKNERTRNEFYIIPVYQKMIDAGMRIETSAASEMWDMGNPQAKRAFEEHKAKID